MFFLREGEQRVVVSINEVIKLLVEISLWGLGKEKKCKNMEIREGKWEMEREIAQYLAYKENE